MSQDNLEGYLRSLVSQAKAHSSGSFSLDVGAARRKMAQFFDSNQVDFLHYWVRFAVSQQARKISLQVKAAGLEFQYEGTPPDPDILAGGILAPSLPPRYLHMGIVGAFQQGFEEVLIETREGDVLFLPDQPERPVNQRRSLDGCRFVARPLKGSRHWKDPKLLQKALSFPGLSVPILLQGVMLPVQVPAAANRLSRLDALGREWRLQLTPGHAREWTELAPAEVHIMVHGADLGGLSTHAFPPCTSLWVEYPEIPLDLSLRKIHEGAPYHRLSLELANLAAQTVSNLQPEGLAELAPPVLDWLAEIHSRAGRFERALEAALQAVHQGLDLSQLICCGLLERAALLAQRQGHSQAEQLRKQATEAWKPHQAAASQADPCWKTNELQKQSPAEHLRTARFRTQWERLVRAGCLCRSEHDGLSPAYERVRGSFCLALYQEQIRLSVYGEEQEYSWNFRQRLREYRKDSLIYNGLRLREAARLPSMLKCTSEMVFSAQVLTAALQGKETLPDQDLAQLTRNQRESLIQLVESLCHRVAQLPPDRHTREMANISEELRRWRSSASALD